MLSYDVVEWGKPLQKAEREMPKPKDSEVLLKLKYCGVCHSDVHIRDGYFDLGGGKRFQSYATSSSPPHLGQTKEVSSIPTVVWHVGLIQR